MKTNKGFTLIELLVVISIIGMISSVVLASLNTARDKAKVAAAQKFDVSTYRAFGADALGDWTFDQATGNMTDQSVYNRPLILMNGVTRDQTDKVRGAGSLLLDGVDDYATIANPPATVANISDTGNSITTSAWIKIAAADQPTLAGFILGNEVNASWQLFVNAGNLIWRTTGITNDLSCPLPKAGIWHHVLATQTGATGATKATLYIDGAQCNTVSGTIPAIVWGARPFEVGRYSNGSGGMYFKGRIDEVKVYGRYLLASEVLNIYAEGLKEKFLSDAR